MTPIIQTHELTKHFTHPLFIWRIRARAVNGLTLQINRGEVFGLLGPNGSGKSTTIKLLLGMLFPTSGEVAVFGQRPSAVAVKQKIGYLPEETALYRFLTAEETLDYYGQLFGIPRRERQHRIDELLDLTGLRHVRQMPLGEFSKGMQRRIGLAQALINDPQLIILDEPTSGLDPLGTQEIKKLIRDLKAKNKTVLLSSHLLDEVQEVCDRVTILYGGKAQVNGNLDDLLRDEQRTEISGVFPPDLLHKISTLINDARGNDDAERNITIAPARNRLTELFLKIVYNAEKNQLTTSGAKTPHHDTVDFLTTAQNAESQPDMEFLASLLKK